MRATDSRFESPSSHRLLAMTALIAGAWLAYHGSFAVPFFFDDHAAITHNPTIGNLWRLDRVLSPPTDGSGMTGRPVVNLSLAFNHAVGGTSPRGYHVFNFVLHSLSALVLFELIRRSFQRPILRARFASAAAPLAFVIALLWTLHPLQTESVTCVIQRTELLVSFFYLLTLYGFGRSVDEPASRIWPVVTVAACGLGMASKEVMVSAPLLVLLFDRTFVAGTFRTAWAKRRGFYLSLAATWVVLIALQLNIGGTRGPAAGFGLGVSWWSYALKQCEAIVTYFALSGWPHPLIVDYGTAVVTDPAQVLPQLLIVVTLAVATFAALKWRPVLGFLGFWFFAVLAPSSSVIPLVTQTMAEHRMYLPLAAVTGLVVTAGYSIIGRRGVLPAAALAVALGALTVARNRTLQDEVGLWADTIVHAPDNARAHASLGLALADRGRVREAVPHYRRALELDSSSTATEQNLGNAYFQLGDVTTAVAHFRRAVSLTPKFASGHNNLGTALLELGEAENALDEYRTALALEPAFVSAQKNLGRALLQLGRLPEAVTAYENVLRLQPEAAAAHYDLAFALARAGDFAQAAPHFEAALRAQPNPASYLNYARFLAQAGRTADALRQIENALLLQPDFPGAQRERERLQALLNSPGAR